MPDGLYLVGLSEIEHTVEPGAHGEASGVCLRNAEVAELSTGLCLHLVGLRIELIFGLAEEPVHSVADARSEIQVFRNGEIRQSDLEIMGHSVLEPVQEARLLEVGNLERHLVLEGGAVSEGELLVEFLLADSVLSLERIEPRHRECQVRQCE